MPTLSAHAAWWGTDQTITVNSTTIKDEHIAELRAAITAKTAACIHVPPLPPPVWGSGAIYPETIVDSVHINELRTALRAIYSAKGQIGSLPTSVLQSAADGDRALASHIIDLRIATDFVVPGCAGALPTCTDLIPNQDETGVDCGGVICPPCGNCPNNNLDAGETCDDNNAINGDGCSSACQCECTPWVSDPACDLGACAGTGQMQQTRLCNAPSAQCQETQCIACAATCTDRVQNGSEIWVDCGGPSCPACPTCSGINCAGNPVTVNLFQQECNSSDLRLWQCNPGGWANTGIACACPGGTCTAGPSCTAASVTVPISGTICYAPNQTRYRCDVAGVPGTWSYVGPCACGGTCSDGVQNQNEIGVDCGGVCPACPPSCSDNTQNQGETGVDCGGPCGACGNPPVNGGWSVWGTCDPSCGPGQQTRICNNPTPAYGGTPCSGSNTQNCNLGNCPQNCTCDFSCSGLCGSTTGLDSCGGSCTKNCGNCGGGAPACVGGVCRNCQAVCSAYAAPAACGDAGCPYDQRLRVRDCNPFQAVCPEQACVYNVCCLTGNC